MDRRRRPFNNFVEYVNQNTIRFFFFFLTEKVAESDNIGSTRWDRNPTQVVSTWFEATAIELCVYSNMVRCRIWFFSHLTLKSSWSLVRCRTRSTLMMWTILEWNPLIYAPKVVYILLAISCTRQPQFGPKK